MASSFSSGDSTTWLNALINTGADAMTNLYYVQFSSSVIADEDSEKYTVRLSSISGLPTFSHKTEPKKFMTVDFDAPINDFDFEKKLTLEFRLDQNYEIYTKLMEIMGKTSKPSLGYATTRISGAKTSTTEHSDFTIKVMVPKDVSAEKKGNYNGGYGNEEFKALYTFSYCWISKISGLESFSWDSAGARTVKAEIYYYDWSGPNF